MTEELLGIATSILSITTPGALLLGDIEASAALARQCNEHLAELRHLEPCRFGLVATLPSLLSTERALAEIEYSLDTLHADGISIFTSYGPRDQYLGHPDFAPIWAELSRRKTVVLIHPIERTSQTALGTHLPTPLIDYPHETGRAALDLLIRETLQTYPGCRVILSHAGGDLPWIIHRLAVVIPHTPLADGRSMDQLIEQAKEFYFDTALSSGPLSLPSLLAFARPRHILFGSDIPNAPRQAVETFTRWIDDSELVSEEERQDLLRGAALQLFPRIQESEQQAIGEASEFREQLCQ